MSIKGKVRQVEGVSIDIPMCPPSYWKWEKMHWSEKGTLKRKAYLLMLKAVRDAGIRKLPVPCMVSAEVWVTEWRTYDAENFVTPIGKLFIDALTPEKTSRRKNGKFQHKLGLGLLPDDSPEYVRGITSPLVHTKAAADRTVLTFKPVTGKE